MFELGDQHLEVVDRAASADPGHDYVAPGADLLVLAVLQIDAAVEVERGAVLVELGPHPAAARQDEIQLVGPGKGRTADRCRRNALRALFLLPLELRSDRMRLHRNAEHD